MVGNGGVVVMGGGDGRRGVLAGGCEEENMTSVAVGQLHSDREGDGIRCVHCWNAALYNRHCCT